MKTSFSQIDVDLEIIDKGLHLVHPEVTASRFERYVKTVAALRDWATTTDQGLAAAAVLQLLEPVDRETSSTVS